MSDVLVWTKRDTHCVWCAERFDWDEASQDEWARHSTAACGGLEHAVALRLRALVEAQAAVIARYQDCWVPSVRADDTHAWRKDSFYPPKWEPMTPCEQQVLYGRVVTEEAEQ